MTLRTSGLPLLLGLCLAGLFLLGAGPMDRASRAETRAWKQVEQAVQQNAPQRLLDRAEEYLRSFPDGLSSTEAHRLAGEAAMQLELWTACRRHFDSYLAGGGRSDIAQVSWQIAICLAREGPSEEARVALRNVAANDPDPERAASAGRELVALQLFEGAWEEALRAQELLLERKFFDPTRDLAESRRAADELAPELLSQLERARNEQPLLAGLIAVLRLEREGLLVDSPDTEDARRRFADRFHEHPLLDFVPGAAEWADEPEDTDPLAIGVLMPLTGRYQVPGELAMRGMELAVEELTRDPDSGLAGLRLLPVDTTGDPEAAVAAARRLVEEDRVIAILGPIIGAEAEAVAEAAEDLGVPLLMITQRSGLAEGRLGVFNTWVTAEEQVDALVEHAVRSALTTFAITYPDRETGGRMAARFWSGVEEAGASVASIESYPSTSTDFRETARRLLGRHYLEKPAGEADRILPWLGERTKPQLVEPQVELEPGLDFQAIFVPDSFKTAAMLAPGFLYEKVNIGAALSESRGLPVVLLGGAALNHPQLIERGGRYVEGVQLVDGFFAGSHEPAVQRFVLSYRERHEVDPSALEATAYDAVRFVGQLLLEGASTRRELRSRLRLAAPSQSVIGAKGFASDGEMRHSMLVLEVRKKKFVQVFPEPPAEPIHLELSESGEILRFRLGPKGERLPVDEETEEETEESSEGGDSPAAPAETSEP